MAQPAAFSPGATHDAPFACWCIWHSPRQLVYVYGHAAHCREILVGVHPSRCISKGLYKTLEAARLAAEEAAGAWREFSATQASARAMSTTAYLAEFPEPGLLCEPIQPPPEPFAVRP